MRTLQNSVAVAALLFAAAPAWAGVGPFVNGVADANPAVGSPANVYSPDFTATQIATGTDPLENPSGPITKFGFLSDNTVTNPDENTYLVLPDRVKGPTPQYNYGHHFLFQGHELFGSNLGYVTRINLDVTDPAHRISLLTPVGQDGRTNLTSIDGSTYDPFTKTLLVTQEEGSSGGVAEVTLNWPATVTTLYGVIGRGGFEGIHTDDRGRVYLVEDSGGASASVDPNDVNGATKRAKQPNSFLYRFVPYDRTNLGAGGKLQALQVKVNGTPLVFGGTSAQQVFEDVWSPAQLALHSGASFPTKWVTIHDTATDGTGEFDANALAKAKGGTPFKRPENGVFEPTSQFRDFFFTITGDTDTRSGSVPGLAARGAWGGIFELEMNAQQESGEIRLFALGDAKHNSFDNITFGDQKTVLVAEDRGDTLHDQLNTLDSLWAYPLHGNKEPVRVVAQGRDPSATPTTSEDNEITGIYVSNGDPSVQGQYGSIHNLKDARFFFTQQHGDDTVYELNHTRRHDHDDD